METILVTGGAGFIGSNFILDWMEHVGTTLVNLDKLTYAGNLRNLHALRNDRRHIFVLGDIRDSEVLRKLLELYLPSAVVHFAAESHVDRSILGPEQFIRTNIEGTFRLLEEVRGWWTALDDERRSRFRFLHVSTDEVYGSLGDQDPPFTEETPYSPNSPYAASKASSDHLVRAYHKTYGLPTLITNCSNNYGPYQFPEKLIPLVISNAIAGKPIPIYGDGQNVRDWLYVGDHCSALRTVLRAGIPGETYNIGGQSERSNLEVVHAVCGLVDEMVSPNGRRRDLIEFVKDRPGHDCRYAIDPSRLTRRLGWNARETFESGLRKTVAWYLKNQNWTEQVRSGAYQQWITVNYEQRGSLYCPS